MTVENDKNGFYYDWKREQLGEEKFDALRDRHREIKQYRQVDYEEMITKFKKMIKAMNANNEGFILGKH